MYRAVTVIVVLLMAGPVWALQVVTGSYTGNATDNTDIVISPACQPVAVFVKRDTAATELIARFGSMGTDESKVVTGGTAIGTTQIKAFNADGFRLGAGSTANGNTATHYYVAICDNGQNDLAVNTWTGDNTDNLTVTLSPSFTPELVIVLQSGTGVQSWRGGTSHSGDSASRLNTLTSTQSNEIQSFGAGSFQVGSGLNATGTTYYSLAIKGSSGVGTGSFTGDTNDNRSITAIANPEFVLIKGDSTTTEPSHRFGIAGDASFCSADASAANIIQSLTGTGFQIGTNTCANENTVTMRWFAITDFSSAAARRPGGALFFP